MIKPIVQINNLSWYVDQQPILDDISLSISQGKFVGVIGVNGSGKTSLLRCIYRYLKPTAGEVLINGNNIWQQRGVDIAQHVAVVSQNKSPMPLQVQDVIAMGLIPHKKLFEVNTQQDKTSINGVIKQLDLWHLRDHDFETLSGGEQQRVLLARAIIQLQGTRQETLAQQLLIMDEPTNHLDIHYQIDLLTRVKGLGVSVIASLHDLNIASEFCDELILIDHGKIICHGTPNDVLEPSLISDIYQVNVDVIKHPKHNGPHLLFSGEQHA